MSHLSRNPKPRGNRDPQLGGDRAVKPPSPERTGFEPLLGGIRRIGPDIRRIQTLIDAPDAATRDRLIELILDVGQARAYSEELSMVVPARARSKSANWRGTFTPPQRIAAMQALARIGGAESIGVLLAALSDSNYEIRDVAASTVIAICKRLDPTDPATAKVMTALVRAMSVVPLNARKVIGTILSSAPPDQVLAPILRDGLTADDWQARRQSAWVLGKLGDIRATKRLIAVMQADGSDAVRATAVWALGQLSAPIAVEPLMLAAADPDEVIRAAAVEALGEHAARMLADDSHFRPTLKTLVTALQDDDWSVRHTAIDTLTTLDRPEARLALQQILKK